ncbi:phosphoethanolamine/phosphocholine phosphatase [Platysternon megacephalum]|uniref:Phosphoethanolamine/phosphocholine phosphatase n=1 Tax=Platysternon megacephalum TaxID=55544 RepID=A0A4D9EQ09_9SAUR|nr:phosphoethanolamine/phosphocholine phosphatase [Platysternon megacephalum]
MLAARTGTVGSKNLDETAKLRKHSVLSLGSREKAPKSSSESSKDNRLNTTGQIQQRGWRLALMRELEMNWYLKICNLSYEHTIAYTTGMPHRLEGEGRQ